MAYNFTTSIRFEKKNYPAAIIPQFRQDGLYYEVNIKGLPRFYVTRTELDRYDIVGDEKDRIPYGLVLAVSDAIEAEEEK